MKVRKKRMKPFDPSTAPSSDIDVRMAVKDGECLVAFSKQINLLRLDREGLAAHIAGLQQMQRAMGSAPGVVTEPAVEVSMEELRAMGPGKVTP